MLLRKELMLLLVLVLRQLLPILQVLLELNTSSDKLSLGFASQATCRQKAVGVVCSLKGKPAGTTQGCSNNMINNMNCPDVKGLTSAHGAAGRFLLAS